MPKTFFPVNPVSQVQELRLRSSRSTGKYWLLLGLCSLGRWGSKKGGKKKSPIIGAGADKKGSAYSGSKFDRQAGKLQSKNPGVPPPPLREMLGSTGDDIEMVLFVF